MQQVEIRVKGQIDRDWSDWISDVTTTHTVKGETILAGSVQDQAALYGLLSRLSDLGLQLNSVTYAGGKRQRRSLRIGLRRPGSKKSHTATRGH